VLDAGPTAMRARGYRAGVQVALVKPGKPFQVVANFESKRKTPALIGFYQVRPRRSLPQR
jgi:hypothetical protein